MVRGGGERDISIFSRKRTKKNRNPPGIRGGRRAKTFDRDREERRKITKSTPPQKRKMLSKEKEGGEYAAETRKGVEKIRRKGRGLTTVIPTCTQKE